MMITKNLLVDMSSNQDLDLKGVLRALTAEVLNQITTFLRTLQERQMKEKITLP